MQLPDLSWVLWREFLHMIFEEIALAVCGVQNSLQNPVAGFLFITWTMLKNLAVKLVWFDLQAPTWTESSNPTMGYQCWRPEELNQNIGNEHSPIQDQSCGMHFLSRYKKRTSENIIIWGKYTISEHPFITNWIYTITAHLSNSVYAQKMHLQIWENHYCYHYHFQTLCPVTFLPCSPQTLCEKLEKLISSLWDMRKTDHWRGKQKDHQTD